MSTPPLDRARAGYRWARKRAKRTQSHVWLAWLTGINARSSRPVTGDADVVVSLTTFGSRLESVAYTVESIAAGTVRPRRLVLWLDDPAAYENRPTNLRRLEARGLEVGLTDNLGPHTKYFPALDGALASGLPLVTADDDILYPRSWLAGLMAAAAAHPGVVNCYRASVVALSGDRLAAYVRWPRCTDTQTSVARFGTGVSGVHYPLAMVRELQRRGTAFIDSCLKADDIWLHWVALRAGIPVRQIDARPRHFPMLPGTQEQSLVADNLVLGRNDDYIAALYDSGDVATLAAAGAPSLD
ncbi:MAG TPA: hypothetical protein VFP34_11240 [Microlunatus sp.]|nr:hypothetical protein [Microlunatus sp.]